MNLDMEHTDLLLVGAGPSNIALGIVLEELGLPSGVQRAVMLECGPRVSWHPGMLFPQAQSQVSFLKDLATLRDPTSRYTFLNYLHATGRLDAFVNLQTFFPYRREIADYLAWCVRQFRRVETRFGAAVAKIAPALDSQGRVRHWTVACVDGRALQARRLVYGAGRQPHLPAPFDAVASPALVHASELTTRLDELDAGVVRSIAVVGGAQSAAEAFQECARRFPAAEVRLLVRSIGLQPYGGSMFTNALYSDTFVDRFHGAPVADRERTLDAMRGSNYAGLTPPMLEALYRQQYLQELDGRARCRIETLCEIARAKPEGQGLRLQWSAGLEHRPQEALFDLVVLGTGYRNSWPDLLRDALAPLGAAPLPVSRSYRVQLECVPGTSLHVLGLNEATHGISDTLLSVVGARARHVFDDFEALAGDDPVGAGTAAPPARAAVPTL